MLKFKSLFSCNRTAVISMIHVGALPGSPNFKEPFGQIVETACKEAEIYKDCNVDGVIIENMHDVPYTKKSSPELISAMSVICTEIKKTLNDKIPCGIQILAGCNKEALAVAKCSSLQFVRMEGFVFSHIGDEGFFDSCAGDVLRYRKMLGAENILIFNDIKKKHSSHSITNDISIEETARASEFFLSDGVIITGESTASPANSKELHCVKSAITLPVLIGSGITIDNFENYSTADAFIIGSYFKHSGRWQNGVSKNRVLKFMENIAI